MPSPAQTMKDIRQREITISQKAKKEADNRLFLSERILAKCSTPIQNLLIGFKAKKNTKEIQTSAIQGSKASHGIPLKWFCIGKHTDPARNAERKTYKLERKLRRIG